MPSATPRRANIRDLLIEKSATCFDKAGFHATGVDAVLAEAGVSRMSMYYHFASKDALIEATVAWRDALFRAWFGPAVEAAAEDARGRLLAIFDALGEWMKRPGFAGSYFNKAAAEFQDRDHPVHKAVLAHKGWLLGYVRGLCERLDLAEPTRLAAELFMLAEGAIVSGSITGDRSAARRARAAAETLLAAAA